MKRLLIVLPLILCGCSVLHSTTENVTKDPKTGVITVQRTHATGWTLCDAQSALAKFRNSSDNTKMGTNVYAPGTYASGVVQESQVNTNLIALGQALISLGAALAK